MTPIKQCAYCDIKHGDVQHETGDMQVFAQVKIWKETGEMVCRDCRQEKLDEEFDGSPDDYENSRNWEVSTLR